MNALNNLIPLRNTWSGAILMELSLWLLEVSLTFTSSNVYLFSGVAYSAGCENAVSILKQLIDVLDYPSVGSKNSFPLIVVSVLPYCLNTFEAVTNVGSEAARNIANVSVFLMDLNHLNV
jgi:hypothetical protein